MSNKGNQKGAGAEEAMRSIFIDKGYFVVRGIEFVYQDNTVTDVDLWLYRKCGALRQRVNVDIKNKKTPQAIERIFWTLGTKLVLRCDRCIVVTTEVSQAVIDFGRQYGVLVIDGNFLKQAIDQYASTRLTEEEFVKKIKPSAADDVGKLMHELYKSGKSIVLNGAGFDSCNRLCSNVRQCFEYMNMYQGLNGSIRPLMYISMAYFLLSLDYQYSLVEFVPNPRQMEVIDKGLRFGSAGDQRINEFASMLKKCAGSNSPDLLTALRGVVNELRNAASALPTDQIVEYVSKVIGLNNIFELSREFEAVAFERSTPTVDALSPKLKSMLLLMVDVFKFDRKEAIRW